MYRFVVVLAVGLIGCGDPVDNRVDDIVALSGDTTSGGADYTRLCSNCHQPDGLGIAPAPPEGPGGTFPDLVEFFDGGASDEAFVRVMVVGPGLMPDFESQDDQVLADILAYAKATF